MGLDVYFVYETEDKSQFEVPEGGYRGLQDLFEYPSAVEELKNSVLNPPFVQDFPKISDYDPSEAEELTDEEIEAMMTQGIEPYVGPAFAPEALVAWAGTWIEIIEELNDEERRVVLPLATEGYNWVPVLLEDLKRIRQQGECAHHHRVKMHLEMY